MPDPLQHEEERERLCVEDAVVPTAVQTKDNDILYEAATGVVDDA